MKPIDCFLITDGKFKPVIIPEDFLIELCRNLRNEGVETVQLKDGAIQVEGVYIPAKGSNLKLLAIPDTEKEEDDGIH